MKSIIEQRKMIRNNDKVIVGAFIGGIIMIVIFTILSWTPTTKFKDIAPLILSSITILIGLFTAAKVLRWHEVKRNDKGFEVAQNIVMNTYQIYIIVLNYSEYLNLIRSNGEINKISLIEKLSEDNNIFKEKYNNAVGMKKSLKKWNVRLKVIDNLLYRMMVLHHTQFVIISHYCNGNDYNHEMEEQQRLLNELNISMDEYNELTVDDIYEFNN
ncbi:hypothetical protein [Tatumella sp. JGM118]|uniref:hypothetical protein n=1 Tax=Tatumella sp. JGM118 TaxID=2799796 RepID=UPI001BAFA10A|nr:hypothetical protein [Tatumella sp. JGM118]MBS0910568.1 hypothetical protein [Tatumella sp. JGM118]